MGLLSEIRDWPSVPCKIHCCKTCESKDIIQNPDIETEWGCANCGNDTIGPSIGFEINPKDIA